MAHGGFNVRKITDFINKDTVFKDAKILSEDYIPDKFLFRDEEINQIISNLSAFFNGFPPNNMFIYGPPSTGKTHIMMSISNTLNEYAENQGEKIKYIYINAGGRTCPQVLVDVAYSVGLNAVINMGTNIISMVERKLNGKYYFIFDEFDRIKKTPLYPNPYDTIINPFTRMGSHVRIAVIVNNHKIYDKLEPATKSSYSPSKLYFRAYSIDETMKIIIDRCEKAFKEGVLEEGDIIYFARWIHRSGVDLRTAFKVLFTAGRIASNGKKEKITYEDLQHAFKEVEQNMLKNTLSKLNDTELVFIHSIAVAQNNHEGGEVEKNIVYETYRRICNQVGLSQLSWKHLSTYITPKIEMQGIIKTSIHGRGRRRGTATFFSIDGASVDEMLKLTTEEVNRRFEKEVVY